MKKIAMSVAALSLFFAITWAAPKANSPNARAASAVMQQGSQKGADETVQTFTGTIAKFGDQYVLRESDSKAPYQLDDQDTASRFAGKKVTVTGTLDAANNLIRVQSIQEATTGS